MIFSDSKTFATGDRVERRLAAILVADVAGYSRLMHVSEEATHARVTSLTTSLPSRRTVMRSESSNASSNACDMNTIETPSDFNRRINAKK